MSDRKQYGLILKDGQKSTKPAIFESDSDEDQKPTIEKRAVKRQTQLEMKRALEQDPSVFEYDSIYDDMQKQKESKKEKVTKDRKSKYISSLLGAAENRKKEHERRTERKVQAEREAEGDEFEDKEAFVTSAYKKKLQEIQMAEEKEKLEAEMEARTDVTKQEGVSDIYKFILKQRLGEELALQASRVESPSKVEVKSEKDQYNMAKEILDAKRSRTKGQELYSPGQASSGSEDDKPKKEEKSKRLDSDSDMDISSNSSDSSKEKPSSKNLNGEVLDDKSKTNSRRQYRSDSDDMKKKRRTSPDSDEGSSRRNSSYSRNADTSRQKRQISPDYSKESSRRKSRKRNSSESDDSRQKKYKSPVRESRRKKKRYSSDSDDSSARQDKKSKIKSYCGQDEEDWHESADEKENKNKLPKENGKTESSSKTSFLKKFAKYHVGDVLEAAKARYMQRKRARKSGKISFGNLPSNK